MRAHFDSSYNVIVNSNTLGFDFECTTYCKHCLKTDKSDYDYVQAEFGIIYEITPDNIEHVEDTECWTCKKSIV